MNESRILVVDDEPKYAFIIQFNLESRGHNVIVAHDGQTAVALAADEELDLIILDVRMPEMDGFEACRQIREFSSLDSSANAGGPESRRVFCLHHFME